MFTPPGMGYDRAITIFSPDGRLFQVEYAYEAVKKGKTTLGIKAVNGVVLAVEKRKTTKLVDEAQKIKIIDDHTGLAFAGLSGDARVLIDQARYYAQVHRLTYGEPIPVELLAKRICDIKQAYTQHSGVRPFGVAFLFAGVDRKGPQLIQTDPGGTYFTCKASAIGMGSQKAIEILEKEYREEIKLEDAILLAIKTLDVVIDGGATEETIEMAIVNVEDKKFKIISKEDLKAYLQKVKSS
ncbi:MAG: proteasome endopeptidase complex, archaeal, alpha subunit [Thermofilum sp. ex4484_79]|nr:MAG: proteasome endopeptidase complex, archaeal, alpha subunit [Thermofilum sp. ex4484_79]